MPSSAPETRLERALLSLEGLSVGDAFGQQFFYFPEFIGSRKLPVEPWHWTDDTAMAVGIVEVLRDLGEIDQPTLAETFARNHHHEPMRGYGGGAHRLLHAVFEGADWRTAAANLFGGQGSFGNGAAMRVAPLGAYFADDLDRVVHEARASSEVTHAHPEGIAGGIAIAVAAALVAASATTGIELLESVRDATPAGETRDGLARAVDLGLAADPITAAGRLGAGEAVSAMDTVPFVVWSVAAAPRTQGRFGEALWRTVIGLGDRDTTCAMVGGIVALETGRDGIPEEWLDARESLPARFRRHPR